MEQNACSRSCGSSISLMRTSVISTAMLLLNWFDRAGAVRHRGQVHHGGKNVLTTRNLTGPDTMHTPAADLVRKG
jgi:hypothetical protein